MKTKSMMCYDLDDGLSSKKNGFRKMKKRVRRIVKKRQNNESYKIMQIEIYNDDHESK